MVQIDLIKFRGGISMTRDSIILGSISGFIGNIFKGLLAWIFYFSGYLQYTCAHIAAGAFVSRQYLNNPLSLVIGFIADYILAGTLGILNLIIIRYSGNDFPLYKSIYFSLVIYLVIYGGLMALELTSALILTPLPNLLLIFPHLLFGTTMGLVISWYNKRNEK